MKISLLILLTLLSNSIFPLEKKDVSFNLFVYDQHGKVLKIEEVKIVKDKIFVNGEALSPIEITLKSKYINSEFKPIANHKVETCPEGKYIFRRSYDRLDTIENGCLGSKRYSTIAKIFDRLKRDVVLR